MTNTSTSSSETTKRMLMSSLMKLMAVKPLEKISIRELVDDCGVNRQTFYYHFQDIYDLVEWMYRQEAVSLFDRQDSDLAWEDGALRLLNYFQENKAVLLCTVNSLGRVRMKLLFYGDIHAIVKRVVDGFARGYSVSPEYGEFLAHFYTVAFAGLLESWVRGDLAQSPVELVALMSTTINAGIQGALREYARTQAG